MLDALFTGRFLTRARVRLWAWAVLVAGAGVVLGMALSAHGHADYAGRPLGTDFSCFYAAGALAAKGAAAAAYDMSRLNSVLAAAWAGAPQYGWFYPPFFLPVMQALSHLGYVPALLLWLLASLLAYLAGLRAVLQASQRPLLCDRLWLVLALGFPAVLINALNGQTGCLSAALLAAGLACLKPRPVLAGVFFALMAFKPQLCMALPFALIAGRQGKAIAAAVVTILCLTAAATLLYGPDIWPAFFAGLDQSRQIVVEGGAAGFDKMVSAFAAIRLWGGASVLAYVVQALVTLASLFVLVKLWSGAGSESEKIVALVLATTLSSPYAVDYDLVLLAIGIVHIAIGFRGQQLLKGEALLWAVLWFLPFAARLLAHTAHLPLVPVLLMTALAFVWRRSRHSAKLSF